MPNINVACNIEELKKLSNLKVNQGIRERIQVVIFSAQGFTAQEIAHKLDRGLTFVKKWVTRYNQGKGIEGLRDLPRAGHPPKVTAAIEARLLNLVLTGPPAKSLLSRYRIKDLTEVIQQEFGVSLSKATIGLFLKKKFSYVSVRPLHPKHKPELIPQWKQELPDFVHKAQEQHPSKKIVLYFMDEARFGMKGHTTRCWAPKGKRTQRVCQNGFTSAYMTSAVNPETGSHFGIVTSCMDTKVMNVFLEEFSQHLPSDTMVILIGDQAPWHKSKDLRLPCNIIQHFIPAYCPQLNPVENLWQYLKSNYLSSKVFKNMKEILSVGCEALTQLTNEVVRSICGRNYTDIMVAK